MERVLRAEVLRVCLEDLGALPWRLPSREGMTEWGAEVLGAEVLGADGSFGGLVAVEGGLLHALILLLA